MMLTVDTSNMTREEIDLLESLVGKVKSKSEPKIKPKKMDAEEYNLEVTTICLTCGAEVLHFFGMRYQQDHTWLTSIPMNVNDFYAGDKEIKEEQRQVLTCHCCRENLLRKDKEELVGMIMSYRQKLVKS